MKLADKCPINTALNYLGKKWTIQIVRDLFFGKKRFKEFIESNNGLRGKVLSERLSELQVNNNYGHGLKCFVMPITSQKKI